MTLPRSLSFLALCLWAGCGVPADSVDGDGWSAEVQARIAAGEYAPRVEDGQVRFTSRSQGLTARLDEAGLVVDRGDGAPQASLRLRGWGREDRIVPAEPAPPELGSCLSTGETDAVGDCLRRVDVPRPGLVEWWENRTDGLEHGFTVTAPPAGEEPLVLELEIAGADVELDGDAAIFVPDAGPSLRYEGLVAWDETGRELPSWLEAADGGLRIVVDDTAAIGTITVDPLMRTVAWSAESDQAAATFGWSTASAGDVNGDGYGDVIVGAPCYDDGQTDEGRAYVFLGSAAGLETTASWTAEGDQSGAWFGFSVASAGDVNGDGYGDVVIAAFYYDNGERDEGRAYVYLGSATGLEPTPSWTAEPDQVSAYVGPVAAAGDVNGDGYGDVLVASWYYDDGETDEGRVSLYLGSSAGLAADAAWTAEGDGVSVHLGQGVGPAGDVNGDGYADVAISTVFYSDGEADEGGVFVYHGSPAGLDNTPAWTAEGNQAGAWLGNAVTAGDVNGDGYDDLLTGAPFYDGVSTDDGAAFLYLGSATGLAARPAWRAFGGHRSWRFGTSTAPAGDVNGDGYGDVVVGARGSASDEGYAFGFYGSPWGLRNPAAWQIGPAGAGENLGWAVSSAGDVDGDGLDDVIIAAKDYTHGSSGEGAVFLYRGASRYP